MSKLPEPKRNRNGKIVLASNRPVQAQKPEKRPVSLSQAPTSILPDMAHHARLENDLIAKRRECLRLQDEVIKLRGEINKLTGLLARKDK